MKCVELSVLVPELATWNNGEGISLEGWISAVGRYDHFLGYAMILSPEFRMHDGCLVAVSGIASYAAWFEALHGDRGSVERLLNHVHVADLFPNSPFPLTIGMASSLEDIMLRAWRAKLAMEFASLEIVVASLQDSGLASAIEGAMAFGATAWIAR